MAQEKKGFWAKLLGSKKASGCCSIKIEEISEDAPEQKDEDEKDVGKEEEQNSAPCCGGPSVPGRGGSGSCCG